MTRCSVLECKNNSSIKNLSQSGVSYHRFPKDPHIKEKWITATGRVNWMPTKSSSICSDHFAENEILITGKGYRYINPNTAPSKKIMSYHEEKNTPNFTNKNIEDEPGPSSKTTANEPYITIDQVQKNSVNIINITLANHVTTKSHKAPTANKILSSSLYSTPSNKKLDGMLRWTRSMIAKKDLKIKCLQARNRRLKRRLEIMEQLLKTFRNNSKT